jgi:hypothetical protein
MNEILKSNTVQFRKDTLKKMLQSYSEYDKALRTEKNWLKAIQKIIDSEIEDKRNNNQVLNSKFKLSKCHLMAFLNENCNSNFFQDPKLRIYDEKSANRRL